MTDAPLQGPAAPSVAGRYHVLSACVGALALVVTVLATYLLGRAVVVPLVNPVESLGAVVMAVLGLVLIVSAVVAVGAWWLLRRRGVPRAGAIALGGAVVLPGAAFLATGGETWMLVAAPLLAGAGWYVVALASARPRGAAAAAWVAVLVGLALAAVVVTGSLLVARGAFEVRSCSAGGAVGTDAAEVPTSCP